MTTQRTIKYPCSLSGLSLHYGRMSRITFSPARANSGIVFRHQGEDIPVRPGSLFFTAKNLTSLTNGRVRLDCVEHVLAAIAGLEITNLEIRLDYDREPPWTDGSAWPFVQKLLAAGLEDQPDLAPSVAINRSFFLSFPGSGSFIKAFPADQFIIDCTISFDNLLGRQRYIFHCSPPAFLINLCRARSFLPYSITGNVKRTMARLPGYRWGGRQANVITYDEKRFITELRFSDEPVRHKILDFIGDLSVFGKMVRGYFVLHKPCHRLNALLVKKLCEIETGQFVSAGGRQARRSGALLPAGLASPALVYSGQMDAADSRGAR